MTQDNDQLPSSMEEKITRMKYLRDDYRRLDAESKALKDEYRLLEEEVVNLLKDDNLVTAGNSVASVSMSTEDVPTVDPEYWEELRQWLFDNGYADCLTKSLKAASVRELWAMGIELPHVSRFPKTKLSLSSR